jgi:hypothetical protein
MAVTNSRYPFASQAARNLVTAAFSELHSNFEQAVRRAAFAAHHCPVPAGCTADELRVFTACVALASTACVDCALRPGAALPCSESSSFSYKGQMAPADMCLQWKE